MLHQNDRLIL